AAPVGRHHGDLRAGEEPLHQHTDHADQDDDGPGDHGDCTPPPARSPPELETPWASAWSVLGTGWVPTTRCARAFCASRSSRMSPNSCSSRSSLVTRPASSPYP